MRPWIPLVLLLLAACDRKQPAPAIAAPIAPSTAVTPRDAAIKSFWQWFAQNAAALYADHDLVAVMKKITVELKRVSPGMLCELSSAQEDRSLILSADGDAELFPVVQALYAARPNVAGWKIVAFRQRRPPNELKSLEFEIEGKKYDPTACSFVAQRNGDRLDIALFSPTEDVSDHVKTIMMVMVDHVIGEYNTETRISGIDYLPRSKTWKTAKPLPALAQLLDETFPPAK